MNRDYITEFGQEHALCAEALECVLKNASILENSSCGDDLQRAENILFSESTKSPEEYIHILDEISEKTGINKFELYLLFYIYEARRGKLLYREKKVEESIITASFDDIIYKMNECKRVKGIYGISRPGWFYGWFKASRFMLGRLQFELSFIPGDVFTGGKLLKKGDKAIRIHIPDNGKSFDRETRKDAYRRAHSFFLREFDSDDIPFICSSWLLSPLNEEFLGNKSNIVDFSKEFKIIETKDDGNVSAVWIFGKEYRNNPFEMPEDNTLQRKYREHLIKGGSILSATGVFVFDGKNIR